LGQQCTDAPRPAMREMWPPGSSTYSAVGRRDVVLLGAHGEHGAVDALEPDGAPVHAELPFDQLVLLVELLDPLAEELAGKRQILVGPLVERVEARDIVWVPEIPPEIQVGGDVHGRLEELEAHLDHVGGDGPQRVDILVRVEVARIQPEAEEPDLGEIDGPGHVDVVLQGELGRAAQPGQGQGRAHAIPEHRDLLRARGLERLPGHARKDLGGGVLEGEVIVLGAKDAPVDQEEIEAALGHVLDERALAHEIEDVGAADAEVGHEEEGRLDRALRFVAIEPGLVLAVELLARRGPDLGLLRVHDHLAEVLHAQGVPAHLFLPPGQHLR